jgi:hypothetical protein
MKRSAFISTAAFIAVAGCVQVPTEPTKVESFPLRATVTPDNHCTVEALGKTYTSIGQVRGAVLPTFSGTLDNGGYHSIGCWVAGPDGSDGDLLITFSGESYQKPFPSGTFLPAFEPPYGSTDKWAGVSFRASTFNAEMLRTTDTSTGSIVVQSDPAGERTIVVDVTAVKYQM